MSERTHDYSTHGEEEIENGNESISLLQKFHELQADTSAKIRSLEEDRDRLEATRANEKAKNEAEMSKLQSQIAFLLSKVQDASISIDDTGSIEGTGGAEEEWLDDRFSRCDISIETKDAHVPNSSVVIDLNDGNVYEKAENGNSTPLSSSSLNIIKENNAQVPEEWLGGPIVNDDLDPPLRSQESNNNATMNNLGKSSVNFGRSTIVNFGRSTIIEFADEGPKKKRKNVRDDSLFKRNKYVKSLGFLDHDTYTLMMLAETFMSRDWFLGFFTFAFQTLIAAQTVSNQLQTSFGDTALGIPVHAEVSVRVVQLLAIIVAVYIQEDVLNAIRIPVIQRIHGPNPWEETFRISQNDKTCMVWMMKVLFPNFLKFSQGMVVLLASWIVIVQSNDVVDLLKDFTALFIISYIDNIIFIISKRGYFGPKFASRALNAEDVPIIIFDDELDNNSDLSRSFIDIARKAWKKGFLIKILSVHVLLFALVTAWLYVVMGQFNGTFVRQKYPLCFLDDNFMPKSIDVSKIYDGVCDGDYNTPQCGYDGGDCNEFNTRFPLCEVPDPSKVSDKQCYGKPYNTLQCGFDGGDCLTFNRKYPKCIDVVDPWRVGNGICDHEEYDTSFCGWDGGDCLGFDFAERRPNCNVTNPNLLSDGKCDGGDYNTLACGWDQGDCDEYNSLSLSEFCRATEPYRLGDGVCDVTTTNEYDNIYCMFDGGDCENVTFAQRFPQCLGECALLLGNGKCDPLCNTLECGFDQSECSIQGLPDCHVDNPLRLGDGVCDPGEYNTANCNWDRGDCIVQDFPDCHVDYPEKIGNGICDSGRYNSLECGYDNQDCIVDKYPECHVDFALENLGNGLCQLEYNSVECGYDSGDCSTFNEYPCYVCANREFKSYHEHETQAQEYGGHLISIHSAEFNDYITKTLGEILFALEGHKRNGTYDWIPPTFWISGDDIISEGEFVHKDLTPFDFANWLEGKPDNVYGDCIALIESWTLEDIDGYSKWVDGTCDFPLPAVYRINAPTAPFNLDCISDWECVSSNFDAACIVSDESKLGNGVCDLGEYNTANCNWDRGDCVVQDFPDCHVDYPEKIGDGICDNGRYNSLECGYDNQDCIVDKYPECHVDFALENLGNGLCQLEYNSVECGYDSGDCSTFNEYPCYACANREFKSYHEHETQAQEYGGHLISIHSAEFNDYITETLGRELYNQHPNEAFWISGTDSKEEGVFVHEDLTPFDFENWYVGEPGNKGSNENCLLSIGNPTWKNVTLVESLGSWADGICSDKYPAVYRINSTEAPLILECVADWECTNSNAAT